MNKTRDEAEELLRSVVRDNTSGSGPVDVLVCPPAVFLERAVQVCAGSGVQVGAQNVFDRPSGAYTGELSPPMLKSVGCTHVLAGHSERRKIFGETDGLINRKVRASLEHGLLPVLCIGETLEERREGRAFEVLNGQIVYGLEGIDGRLLMNVVIAYEPVWAIGTGMSATCEQAEEAHRFIRETVERFAGAETASGMRIIYGGSVNTENAEGLLGMEDIDGALIGGACLKAESFGAIINTARRLTGVPGTG